MQDFGGGDGVVGTLLSLNYLLALQLTFELLLKLLDVTIMFLFEQGLPGSVAAHAGSSRVHRVDTTFVR